MLIVRIGSQSNYIGYRLTTQIPVYMRHTLILQDYLLLRSAHYTLQKSIFCPYLYSPCKNEGIYMCLFL